MSESDPAGIQELKQLIADKLSEDRVREKAFDQLYEELRQYKEDFLFQAEKPLLLDLLLFYDSLNWFQESLIKQEMSPDVVADSFQYLIDEFLELLYRRDVVPFESTQKFDRKRQKAVKVEPTDDAGADQTIKQVLKRGFNRSDKILRPEEVVILRHKKKK
ncbi:MAG: nucleotide exchange factor GrpE [Alphaproteobacteria bacterium]|nr:nucleotide exchange factor GrpE [Alphaproteobacteria bacterium]MCB9690408.1 nucleotide exchange factor GrpE [Alphaproteobacteria bacterium]